MSDYHTILDSEEREKLPVPLWKYGLIILALSSFFIPGYTFLIQTQTPTQRFTTAGVINFFSLPMLALFIGLLGAIIPYRKRSYGNKLARISMMVWMTSIALFDTGLLLILFFKFVLHGPRAN